jgi:hypothetical protein
MSIALSPKQLMVKGMSPLIWSMAFRRCTHIRVTTHPNPLRRAFPSGIWMMRVVGVLWKGDHRQSGESDHSFKL